MNKKLPLPLLAALCLMIAILVWASFQPQPVLTTPVVPTASATEKIAPSTKVVTTQVVTIDPTATLPPPTIPPSPTLTRVPYTDVSAYQKAGRTTVFGRLVNGEIGEIYVSYQDQDWQKLTPVDFTDPTSIKLSDNGELITFFVWDGNLKDLVAYHIPSGKYFDYPDTSLKVTDYAPYPRYNLVLVNGHVNRNYGLYLWDPLKESVEKLPISGDFVMPRFYADGQLLTLQKQDCSDPGKRCTPVGISVYGVTGRGKVFRDIFSVEDKQMELASAPASAQGFYSVLDRNYDGENLTSLSYFPFESSYYINIVPVPLPGPVHNLRDRDVDLIWSPSGNRAAFSASSGSYVFDFRKDELVKIDEAWLNLPYWTDENTIVWTTVKSSADVGEYLWLQKTTLRNGKAETVDFDPLAD